MRELLVRVLLILSVIIAGGAGLLWWIIHPLVRALRDKEARFRELTELSSDWYWQMDERLLFTELNGNRLAALGLDANAWLGRPISEIPVCIESPNGLFEILDHFERREVFHDLEISLAQPGTESRLYHTLSGTPQFDVKGRFTGYRGVGRDITLQEWADR